MSKPKYRTFRGRSGILIHGQRKVRINNSSRHMERAYALMTHMEAPKYGTVQSYDGAGISGGPAHFIAIYPNQKNLPQGDLWKLLARMRSENVQSIPRVTKLLKKAGWSLTDSGKIVDAATGQVVPGALIRNEVAPVNGRVPRKGPNYDKAVEWASALHVVMSDPTGFTTQMEFTIDWLLRGMKKWEDQVYNAGNDETWGDISEIVETASWENPHGEFDQLPLWTDLAMCVYHAFSVNAPGAGRTCLKKALKKGHDPKSPEFAKELIKQLGRSSYGNWKVRYRHTRKAAMELKFWPENYFTDYMPASV